MRGLTNEAAWIWRNPVFASASISLILSAVMIGPGSIWNPSRGPSSWTSTCFGRSVMVLSLVRSGGSSAHQACKFSRGLPERVGHRRVDQRAQVPAQRQARLAADHLGREHDGQLFPGVDPEGGRGSATPEIFAKRAGHTRPRVA